MKYKIFSLTIKTSSCFFYKYYNIFLKYTFFIHNNVFLIKTKKYI